MSVSSVFGSAIPLDRRPCAEGYRPVAMLARLGAHTGDAANARRNRTPPAARVSMCGVRTMALS